MNILVKFFVIAVLHRGAEAYNANRFHNGTNRIVGGQNAQAGDLPFQVYLRFSNGGFCGGSIIKVNGKHVILTAAHCLPDVRPRDITVYAGMIKRSQRTENEQRRSVTRIISHSRYNSRTFENDIAILGLNQQYQENSYVAPIALPSSGVGTSGNVIVSGWGDQRENGDNPSDNLKWVELPIVSNSKCQQVYGSRRVTAKSICAGFDEGGYDSCQGDSGGPMYSISGGYLAGVVSNGDGCARANTPGIYTRVSHFIDWIESNAARA